MGRSRVSRARVDGRALVRAFIRVLDTVETDLLSEAGYLCSIVDQ